MNIHPQDVPAPGTEGYNPAFEKLRKLSITATVNENAKSKASAMRRLKDLAWKNPEMAQQLGIDVVPPEMTRVMKFGCLAAPVVLDREEWNDATRTQMTFRHDLYNFLVEGSRSLYAMAVEDLMRGPNFRALRSLYVKKDGHYDRMREINQQAKTRVKGPEIEAILEEIRLLKDAIEEMGPLVVPELRAFYGGEVYKRIMDNGGLLAELCKRGYQTYAALGLYHTNYNPTVVEFSTAFKATFKRIKTIMRGLEPHYANRDGSFPAEIGSWVAWDGAGKTGITVTNKFSPTKEHPKRPNSDRLISTVMEGTNSCFRLRRMTEQDQGRFSLRSLDLTSKASQRIYIAELKVVGAYTAGTPVFTSIPFVLHRPLPPDAQLVAAVIEAKKVNFRLQYSLLVTVSTAVRPSAAHKEDTAEVVLDTEGQGLGSFNRTGDSQFQEWLNPGGRPRFAWVTADNRFTGNPYVSLAEERSQDLTYHVGEYISQAINRLKEMMPSVGMPAWFYEEGFDLTRRGEIRRLYRTWRSHFLNQAREASVGMPARFYEEGFDPFEEMRLTFRKLRESGRNIVKNDWERAIKTVAFAAEDALGIPFEQAEVLAILSIAVERWEHLKPWATNQRSRSLRRRTHEYRYFASRFLEGVSTLKIPAKSANRPRHMSDENRNFGASFLIDALRFYAEREGVAIIEVK